MVLVNLLHLDRAPDLSRCCYPGHAAAWRSEEGAKVASTAAQWPIYQECRGPQNHSIVIPTL